MSIFLNFIFNSLIGNQSVVAGNNSATALNLIVGVFIKNSDSSFRNEVVIFLYDQIISAHVIIPVIILLR